MLICLMEVVCICMFQGVVLMRIFLCIAGLVSLLFSSKFVGGIGLFNYQMLRNDFILRVLMGSCLMWISCIYII